jgi:hypothetical protein
VATRYRLRFLLQEFDLAKGATLIGRSAECHVTIEDPLVSRQHARIVIGGDDAVVEDLGSRNGVKVNGQAIKGTARLKDGDRLRIGTQELVFCQVGMGAQPPAKTTGFLRYCAQCRLPYPQELAACPACGATEQTDEETLSGQFGSNSKHSWSVQLLVEVTEKALALDRISDAARMLQRAKAQIEERMSAGTAIEPEQIDQLARSGIRVTLAASDPTWACWVIHLHSELRIFPSTAVLDALTQVGAKYPAELTGAVSDLLKRGRLVPSSDAERAVLSRLEKLHEATMAQSGGGGFDDPEATNPGTPAVT